MRHRTRDSGAKFARCTAILVYFSVRDWTRFFYVIGFEKYPDLPVHLLSDSLRIYVFFPLCMESKFKSARICCGIRRMSVDESLIPKEKNSQKYPLDTCGLGLSVKLSDGEIG